MSFNALRLHIEYHSFRNHIKCLIETIYLQDFVFYSHSLVHKKYRSNLVHCILKRCSLLSSYFSRKGDLGFMKKGLSLSRR